MQFIKNVLLSLLIIIGSTVVVVYYPGQYLGLGDMLYYTFAVLIFARSVYIFYFIFRSLFPDERNAAVPAQILMLKGNTDLFFEARKTTAALLTTAFTIITVALGVLSWNYFPFKYRANVLAKEGIKTTGVTTYRSDSKYNGIRMHYKFVDSSGNFYEDALPPDAEQVLELQLGDSLDVIYSPGRPYFNSIAHKCYPLYVHFVLNINETDSTAFVTITKNGKPSGTQEINGSKTCTFEPDACYVATFSKNGYRSKAIYFNTFAPKVRQRQPFSDFIAEVRLQKLQPGETTTPKVAGFVEYEAAKEEFEKEVY